ncbi:HTH-type transcriptional regulator McbR [Peptococcaceae bacterium CEB3]|nr:HTH-type transcriptional regulator McbR [Peptococcaceae bacterium CEB3]
MTAQFTPIRFDEMGNIRDSVFLTLRNAILQGKLLPGERLVERDIAERLGISRTPVRESIRKLELERLVTHIPRKGVVVTGFSKEDVMEITAIRKVLEGLICSIAAGKIKARDLERLETTLKQLQDEHDKGNYKKVNQLHDRFHEIIYKAAESPRIYEYLNTIRDYIHRFAEIAYTKPGRTEEALVEHDNILRALRNHDSQEAEEAVKAHVEKSSAAYIETVSL